MALPLGEEDRELHRKRLRVVCIADIFEGPPGDSRKKKNPPKGGRGGRGPFILRAYGPPRTED